MKTTPRLVSCRQTVLIALAGLVIGIMTGLNAEARSRDDRIAQARRDWLIGLTTEKKIAEELARYQASDQSAPEVIQLYETYLDRVRRLTEEKRRLLEALEGPRGARSAKAAPSGRAAPGEAYDPQIPEDQELEEIRALNQELDQSLAAFDDMLLREIEQSRVQSELKMQKLAREAARAAKSLKAQGQMEGSEGAESAMREGQSSNGAGNETGEMEGEREGEHQEAGGVAGERDAAASQKSSGEGTDMARGKNKRQGDDSGESGSPGDNDNLNTQDDDIVARQLREAAEKETDPELKEKLWEEYRDYKRSI